MYTKVGLITSLSLHAGMLGLIGSGPNLGLEKADSGVYNNYEVSYEVSIETIKADSSAVAIVKPNITSAPTLILNKKAPQVKVKSKVQPIKSGNDTALNFKNSDQLVKATTSKIKSTSNTDSPGFFSPRSVSSAEYASNPMPEYPISARRRAAEGTVTLIVDVNAIGKVRDISIKTSSGFEDLDHAAAHAVSNWEFLPAVVNGNSVASRVLVPVVFKLQSY